MSQREQKVGIDARPAQFTQPAQFALHRLSTAMLQQRSRKIPTLARCGASVQ